MKTEVLKTKEGEVLRNKETNKELVEHWFEPGDEFIPCFNKVFENSHEAMVKGNKKTIVNYSIKARVRGKDKKAVVVNGEEELFIRLTPTQAKTLKKKILESGLEINQHMFVAYLYESKEWGTQIGVGLKGQAKPAKKFEDFDNVKFTDEVDYEAIQEDELLVD